MEHKGTKIIETQRLILRPFNNDDAESMYENWAKNSKVTQYLSWQPHKNVEVTKNILKDWVSQYQNLEYYQWAIVLKEESDQPIGSMGSVGNNELTESILIGYCIGEKWWGQGIASEALSAVIQFFFEEVKANRLSATHFLENPASGKVMKKCGFKYEGTMRSAAWCPNDSRVTDLVAYSILAEDYSELK